MVTLIQLEYILAVDTYRHFATAAERCFVTQPTLSMQIKKMEEQLGVVIFDRTKQPVIPTEQGKRIIAQARIILREAAKIDTLVQELKGELSGHLRIAVIPTIAPYLLPLFTGNYKRKFPKISLKVEEQVTEKIVESLEKDLIDVGVLVTPLHEKQIIEMPLYYEEMLIYSNKHHPMASREVIRVGDMATSDIWLLNDGHCFRHQVVNLCDLHDIQRNSLPFEFEGGSLETLMRIIDKEGGYTLIPELAAGTLTPDKQEQVRHFSYMLPLREVSLVYTRRYAKTAMIEQLAHSIKASVPQHFLDKERGTLVEWK